jgi:hypothetical protein
MHYINKNSSDFLLGNVVAVIIMSNNVVISFQNLWHLFEHVTESKDHVIESLLKELDESEEQYAKNFQSHTEIIDQLIGMHNSYFLKERYQYSKLDQAYFSSVIQSDSRDSTFKETIISSCLVLSRSLYAVLSNPVANPDPEVRSGGKVK